MGIAERFKNKLNLQDIFSKNSTDTKKYVSKPIENISSKEYPLADLESKLIEKIRRTPYWKEFSTQKQENLINLYFKKKQNKYEISEQDKNEFIKNIMILSNHD